MGTVMTKEFSVLGEVKKGISRTVTLEMQRADFDLFMRLIDIGSAEGQRNRGRLARKVQEGSLHSTGAGHPGVRKDKHPVKSCPDLSKWQFISSCNF